MPHRNERQRRLLAAAEARVLGYGGVALVAEASGLSRTTIYRGLEELDQPALPGGYARRPGGGRKPLHEQDPSLLTALEALIAPATRGHPESPLRWTCKSTRQLAEALRRQGYVVAHRTVADLLRHLGYSLQANAKKKELVGDYENGGREWQPKGRPERVQTHDFPNPKAGKAIPYGVYDLGRNQGWVNVGCDHDTASFAVESIRRWWRCMGRKAYPGADRLLVCADAGGSNGFRLLSNKGQGCR